MVVLDTQANGLKVLSIGGASMANKNCISRGNRITAWFKRTIQKVLDPKPSTFICRECEEEYRTAQNTGLDVCAMCRAFNF